MSVDYVLRNGISVRGEQFQLGSGTNHFAALLLQHRAKAAIYLVTILHLQYAEWQ